MRPRDWTAAFTAMLHNHFPDHRDRTFDSLALLRDDIGADSLDMLEIALWIDEEAGHFPNDEELGRLKSVGDVVRFCEALSHGEWQGSPAPRAGASAPPFAFTPGLPPPPADPRAQYLGRDADGGLWLLRWDGRIGLWTALGWHLNLPNPLPALRRLEGEHARLILGHVAGPAATFEPGRPATAASHEGAERARRNGAAAGDRPPVGDRTLTPEIRAALESERAALMAENADWVGWGAAVGARHERIREIEAQLRRDERRRP